MTMLNRQSSSASSSWLLVLVIALTVLFFCSAGVNAAVITGTAYDEKTSQPVPSVTVRVEGTGRSMLANNDGQYRLTLPSGVYELKFTHVAYYSQRLTLTVGDSALTADVRLQPAPVMLPGIKVYQRAYDPAQRIIVEAIARKDEILSMIHAYQFEAYSKLVLRDTAKDDSSNIMLIIESQLSSSWEYPHKYKEIVRARRISSNLNEDNVLMALGELTNFNQDRLDIADYSVVSPTAHDALDHYQYYLLDTVYIDNWQVFRLEIEPKSSSEPLFVGTIDIVDSTFVVVGVDVGVNEGFDVPYLRDVRYRENYACFENEYWVPIEIRYDGLVEIGLPGIPIMSLDYVAALHDFSFNLTHPNGTFDEYWIEVAEDADDVDSIAWNAGQLIPLTPEENRGYYRLDSVAQAPRSLPRRLLRTAVGGLGIALFRSDIFHFNRVEGTYLGNSFTFDRLVPRTELHARTGYAFSAKRWQHRYGFDYALSEQMNLRLGGGYHDEMRRRSTIISDTGDNVTLTAITNKTDPFDYHLEKGFQLRMSTRVFKQTRLQAAYHDVNQYSLSNATEYGMFRRTKKHRPNPAIREGKMRSVAASFSYDSRKLWKYKGRERKFGVSQYTLISVGAELSSAYFYDNDFDFVRYYARLHHRRRTFGLGVTSLFVYAGASDKSLPPQKYFTVDFGARLLDRAISFKTLGEKNFYGSRALVLYGVHDFRRILFRKSGLPLLEKFPFTVRIFGGAFWTDFHGLWPQPSDSHVRRARTPYTELGFGFGRITPLDFKLYFTWQSSAYDTEHFSITMGGGF
ncbi:MAG: DUF5686 family protein [bacterium]